MMLNKMRKLLDFLIVVLPAIACLLVYFSDESLKMNLTLIPAKSTIVTMYTTNFVHYTLGHLIGNLVGYLIFSLLSLIIYHRYRRIFEVSFITILLIVPVASSLFSEMVLPPPAKTKLLYGFSAVSSAVIGLFGFGIVLYMSSGDRRDVMYSYLFLALMSAGAVALTYGAVHIVVAFIPLALSLLALTARRHRDNPERSKKYFKALPLLAFYLLGMGSIFPEQLVLSHSFVNIVGHWTGLALGVIIPYFVWMIDGLFRKPVNHINVSIER